jgi:D-beta-D-heptose 7-phosphate kinase/D-beta-D-heptose 1-phosphate adenosyltransferase
VKELKKFNRILIFGDIILDKWVYGDVKRYSPEAPIPIINPSKIKYNLGGASNVAVNLKSLNVPLKLFGTIGKDSQGLMIKKILKKFKIPNKLFYSPYQTTEKIRFVNHKNKQLLRVDNEKYFNSKKLISFFLKNIKKDDLILLSDYKKGVISQNLVKEILKINKNIIVDPKNKKNYYKNCFLIKPNMLEFLNWSKTSRFSWRSAEKIKKEINCKWMIITNSSKGCYILNDKFKKTVKIDKVDVKDVSGSGDIFLSILAYYMFKNFNIVSSTKLAARVATLTVKERGISIVNKKYLKHKIVFTNGCFDILHRGHLKLLKFSKKIGDKLIIGINSDDSVKKLKGKSRPINNIAKRINSLKKINLADEIIIFNEISPINLIKKIQPDIIVKGGDYKKKNVVGNKIAKVKIFPLIKGLSTTSLANL